VELFYHLISRSEVNSYRAGSLEYSSISADCLPPGLARREARCLPVIKAIQLFYIVILTEKGSADNRVAKIILRFVYRGGEA
jgi:hypothetical protein